MAGVLPVLVAAAALAPAARASVTITADPPLQPGFSTQVYDYVSRCEEGKPIHFSVSASDGDAVGVAGRPERSGSYGVDVERAPDASLAIRVRSKGVTSTHHVRCLPADFPGYTVTRNGTPQAQWYMVTPIGPRRWGYGVIVDRNGTPVWWHRSGFSGPWNLQLLPNGHLAWTRGLGDPFGLRKRNLYEERRLDDTYVRKIRAHGGPTDTHELKPLANGNYLVLAYRKRMHVNLKPYGGSRDATVYDCEIQELTPDNRLVWRWKTKDHISPAETGHRWFEDQVRRQPYRHYYDLVHANSLEPDGDGLIMSARHLDAIYRIDRRTGEIDWKLGGVHTDKSLEVIGGTKGVLPLGGQHDARLLPDGTLTAFDNGSKLNRPPRAVRFRIDREARTATFVERVGTPLVDSSICCGSARRLPGGNWVMNWGGNSVFSEETPLGGVVLAVEYEGLHAGYRAFPVLPGRLSAAALRRGMDRAYARRRAAASTDG
jgi:hypothetical protein